MLCSMAASSDCRDVMRIGGKAAIAATFNRCRHRLTGNAAAIAAALRSALHATPGARIAIDDWSTDTAWHARMGAQAGSRWLSTNHLMGDGYWVWLIPLASGSTSVGVVADPTRHPYAALDSFEKVMAWLARYEPQCAERIVEHRESLQDFIGLPDLSYGCKQVFSPERWCLTGEAGAFLDPFYSPGSDFIGFANTFVTELIRLDRSGRRIDARAQFFNDLYFDFFFRQLVLYENQYPVMRHGRIMPLKIIWDFAYYWSVPAFIFFQERLCDLHMYAATNARLEESDTVNREMQALFRHANQTVDPTLGGGFLDMTQLPFMRQLNEDLRATFVGDAFNRQLDRNIDQLQELAAELRIMVPALEQGTAPLSALTLLADVYPLLAR